MGQISAYQEAPYQGVSQAPPQVRRRDQAEALEDCITAIPQGLEKRPPFQYVGTLANHPGASNGVFHHVERTAGDAIYTITKEGGAAVPRVYLLSTLAIQGLTIDAGAQTYLNAGLTTPQHDLGCNTVADFTFTWNRTQNVANAVTLNAARPFEALIWVRAGSYGKTYSVETQFGSVSVITPDGTTAPGGRFVDTDVIAASLVSGAYTALDGASVVSSLNALLLPNGFTVEVHGSVIYISHPTSDFVMNARDGQAGTAMVLVKDKIQKFSDLPAKGPEHGFVVRITQQSITNQDDFYVTFVPHSGASDTGVWTECLAPSAQLGLDKATMPMGLVYDAGWKLEVLNWKQRATGNEELVRDPDFIGQAVQDVAFWQGRLGIVSGEGVTLSCADDPFQLYPRTLAALLDSDPIGRINPAPGETTFRYAVPYENRLVLFGDNLQGQVTYDGILTPSKANIDTFTAHELSRYIRPGEVNGKLYFATPKGAAASGIEEVAVDRVTATALGEDLTTAAFRYLPAGIDRSAICRVNYMAAYGVSGSADIYLHLFRYSDQERIQNAFERWHLPTGFTLGGMFFVNTTLYVLAVKGGKGHILKMDLSPLVLDPDPTSTIQTFLDLRCLETQVTGLAYNAGTDKTTMTLPYDRTDETVLVVRAPGTVSFSEAYLAEVDAVASAAAGTTKLVVNGNFSATPFFVGHKYESRYTLSKIYPLDANKKPLRNGRCQLRRMTLDLSNTGYVRAEVRAGGRDVRSYEFFGFIFDDPGSHFDTAPNATRRWSFPVMAENEQVQIDLVNDSPFGFGILGYEWVGEFNPKSQRT